MSQLCKIINQSACDGKACIDLTSIIWKCGCGEMKQMWDGGNALEGHDRREAEGTGIPVSSGTLFYLLILNLQIPIAFLVCP